MMGLPPEILDSAFSYLHRRDLKACRLVSWSFEAVASPRVFAQALVAFRKQVLDALENIAAHPVLHKYVKEIRFTDHHHAIECFESRSADTEESKWVCTEHDDKLGLRDNIVNWEAGSDIIARALQRLPNVVKLTNCRTPAFLPGEAGGEWTTRYTEVVRYHREAGWITCTWVEEEFKLLMGIFDRLLPNHRLKWLAFSKSRDHKHILPSEHMIQFSHHPNREPENWILESTTVSNLTHLTMEMLWHDDHRLSKFLQQAAQLQWLEIRDVVKGNANYCLYMLDPHFPPRSNEGGYFESVTLPKLKMCHLVLMSIAADFLQPFMSRHPHTTFRGDCVALSRRTWSELVNDLAQSQQDFDLILEDVTDYKLVKEYTAPKSLKSQPGYKCCFQVKNGVQAFDGERMLDTWHPDPDFQYSSTSKPKQWEYFSREDYNAFNEINNA